MLYEDMYKMRLPQISLTKFRFVIFYQHEFAVVFLILSPFDCCLFFIDLDSECVEIRIQSDSDLFAGSRDICLYIKQISSIRS
jgi:hypothetical protein